MPWWNPLSWFKQRPYESSLPRSTLDVPMPRGAVLPRMSSKKPKAISDSVMAWASEQPVAKQEFTGVVPEIPKPIPGVVPSGIAMDDNAAATMGYAFGNGLIAEGLTFLGHPYLAQLAQRPEYRKIVEIYATECTRKWIELYTTGDDDKSKKLEVLNTAMETKYHLRDNFRRMIEVDGFFGRSHIFLDTGYPLDNPELESVLVNSPAKIGIDGLKKLTVVEPFWTYPAIYDSVNPLDKNFYKPEHWYVQGKKIHKSRLIPLVSREVPDIIKPLYMFGGLALTQMAKPYVDNFLDVRTNVSDLIASFNVNGLKTDLDSVLSGDASTNVFKRVDLFNRIRNNRGTMLLDEATEDFFNITTPLTGLHELQAQAQEQIASVTGIPLVKLLGITPSGLNASSEGEIRVFYDSINSYQEQTLRDILQSVLNVIQLSTFGEIDPDIKFKFLPLWEMDEQQKAQIRAENAQTASQYLADGVILPEEERERLSREDGGVYNNLDLSVKLPEPVQEDEEGGGGDEEEEPPDDSETDDGG